MHSKKVVNFLFVLLYYLHFDSIHIGLSDSGESFTTSKSKTKSFLQKEYSLKFPSGKSVGQS